MRNLARTVFSLIMLLILFTAGCENPNSRNMVDDGLAVNSISYGLGGDIKKTTVSYNFNLWNKTGKSIKVISVIPVISNDLIERLNGRPMVNEINRTIKGNSAEVITGSFYLDTEGLDKDQIERLNVKLQKFRIITEQVIGIEKNNY
ncbi:hypothetical protein [Paenibacillus tuaregi]|uniref:hypothetical protein n=1 Tax=Paenibacillus tuaregi TaxID=1816681 RepID=UPI0008394841|nr:hypothetical protein [Paenibacillus tuaregi]